MKLTSTLLSRVLFIRNTGELTALRDGIVGVVGGVVLQASYAEIESIHQRHGQIWMRLEIKVKGIDAPVRMGGLSAKSAVAFQSCVLEQTLREPVTRAITALAELLGRDHYLNHREWQKWVEASRSVVDKIPADHARRPFADDLRGKINRLLAAVAPGDALRTERNRRFTANELTVHSKWFDELERYPLTQRQREAIVCDEDNTLVVAGAGTGKTSTIIGKVGYLLRRKLAHSNEILLLAFARKARDEMAERVVSKFCVSIEIRTFHSLGLDILATATGAKPSLSSMSEDQELFRQAIEGYLEQAFKEPKYQEILRRFFIRHRYPQRSEFDYKTAHEYYRYLACQGLRTLRGERVKSFGELVIADFMTAHGVAYIYEAPYEIDTATREHRQYKPDFYLPDHKIYIEYFGTDRQGNTAPYINRAEYQAGMDWKRATHNKHGTILLELFACDLWEGHLETLLAKKLEACGVPIHLVSGVELHKALKDGGELGRISGLLSSFLGLFKSNNWSLAEVRQRVASAGEAPRSQAFLDVFETVMDRYTGALAAAKEIDFHDMIAQATAHVQAGRYRSPFRYVIVDEFQDISRGRGRLLQALLAQQQDRRLFCVGDDWQSIYRFTGSDVGIMTQFSDHFGHTQRVDLDQAFRFSREILDASTQFILENPQQLRKQLKADRVLASPAVKIICQATGEPEGTGLERALAQIQGGQNGKHAAVVMLLGRYKFSLPSNLSDLRARYSPLEIEARTVHTAKGLEADYIVVLEVTAGRYGFPTEVADDPVINLVLASGGNYRNAEERRLFYVALTRARQRVYLVTDEAKRSTFIEELESEKYKGLVEPDGVVVRTPCPKCNGGGLVKRRGEFGVFWGCSNFPYCDGKGKTCPRCQDGTFVRQGSKYTCSNTTCDEEAEACPLCADGILKERHSQYGAFLGCSNWSPDGPSCNYKRDERRRRR